MADNIAFPRIVPASAAACAAAAAAAADMEYDAAPASAAAAATPSGATATSARQLPSFLAFIFHFAMSSARSAWRDTWRVPSLQPVCSPTSRSSQAFLDTHVCAVSRAWNSPAASASRAWKLPPLLFLGGSQARVLKCVK
jgi:hypothetical protein